MKTDRARHECGICHEHHYYAWQAGLCCDVVSGLLSDDDEPNTIRSID